jgi:hypothetical protein
LESGIGGGKQGKGTSARKASAQLSLGYCRYQRTEAAVTGDDGHQVIGQQYAFNGVDHSIGGLHVGQHYVDAVDGDLVALLEDRQQSFL